MRVVVVGKRAVHQLEGDEAELVDLGLAADAAGREGLGRAEELRRGVSLGGAVVVHRDGDAEITDPRVPAFVDEDVRRLVVTVQDPVTLVDLGGAPK